MKANKWPTNYYNDYLSQKYNEEGSNRQRRFSGWGEIARKERERKALASQRSRELEVEAGKLALLEREESQLSLLAEARSSRLAAPVLVIGLLGSPFLVHSALLAFVWLAVLLAGLVGDVELARRRVRRVRERAPGRRREWERVVGLSGEFGPRLPELGFQIAVADRREIVDAESGTVSVDFCRRELEWRAEGWREERFVVAERVPVGDEAELASRWFDFCATLAEESRRRALPYQDREQARLQAELESEARHLRIELNRGAAERLALPRPESDYLP